MVGSSQDEAARAAVDPCASTVGDLVPDHRADEKGPNWSNLKSIADATVNRYVDYLFPHDDAQDRPCDSKWTICDPNEGESWPIMETLLKQSDAANAVVAVGARSGVLKATKGGKAVLFLRMDHATMTQWRARYCKHEGARHTDLSRSYVDLTADDGVHVLRATRLVQLEKDEVHHPDALAMLCLLMKSDWIPKNATRPPKKIYITGLRLVLLPPLPAPARGVLPPPRPHQDVLRSIAWRPRALAPVVQVGSDRHLAEQDVSNADRRPVRRGVRRARVVRSFGRAKENIAISEPSWPVW